MKTSKTHRRALFLLTAVALLVCGIFLTRSSLRQADTGAEKPISRQTAPESETDAATIPTPSRELEEPSITYVSQHGGETLKLVMDRFVARSAAGQDEIVALNPPATPATLAKRLAEHEAPRGVFPLAYDETDTYDGLRTITSEIRADVPFPFAEPYHQQYLAKPGSRPYCSAQPSGVPLGAFPGSAYLLPARVWESYDWSVAHCVLRGDNAPIPLS